MERDEELDKIISNTKISTHTLTWSVTFWNCVIVPFIDFNSHAHVERDPCQSIARARVVYFNSHAHVERDDDMLTCVFEVINFNSHAHVERDE